MITQEEIRKELLKKVQEYFKRTIIDSRTEHHEPDEEGLWRIIGGTRVDLIRKEIPEIFHGKFSNAVAYAVQRDDFWSDSSHRSSLSDGIVKKVHIQELPDSKISRVLLRDYGPIVEYE